MAALPVVFNWKDCALVEVNPLKVSGVPILKGTRMPVSAILENYLDGMEAGEIAEVFELPADSVRGLLDFAVEQDATLRP